MNENKATPDKTKSVSKTIPHNDLMEQVLSEAASLSHGIVTLELHVRDGRPVRAVVSRSRSILLEGGAKC